MFAPRHLGAAHRPWQRKGRAAANGPCSTLTRHARSDFQAGRREPR